MRLLLLLVVACEPTHAPNLLGPWPAGIPADELEAREALAARTVTLSGTVVDDAGNPVEALVGVGSAQTWSVGGRFELDVPRHNALLEVQADGHRPDRRPVHLYAPEDHHTLAPVVLTPRRDDEVRFLFAGDAALGRRFLDKDESTPWDRIPPDDPNALIKPSDPLPGTRAVFNWIAPLLEVVDFPVCNLESPVLDRPDTPHPTKPYVFFTLPDSLDAFAEQGFRYMSLGNNHVYDYLDLGLADTVAHVEARGIGHSGAGATPDEAFLPWTTTLAGHRYSFLSMSSVSGFQYDIGFNADDTRGGSADLDDSARVRGAITRAWDDGAIPIAQLHTGREYTERPDATSSARFQRVADDGAALLIGHHPHFFQGYGFYDGVLAAHSLGNFAFDQDRVETMVGALLQVDMQGADLRQARTLPIYLEDYRPRPMVGPAADRAIRRMGWSSQDYGAWVVSEGGWARITEDPDDVDVTSLDAVVTVTIEEDGVGVLDLRHVAPANASLASVRSPVPLDLTLGRDALIFGDFEDIDVDEQDLDFTRWDVEGDSRFPCVSRARTGAVGLCSIRDSGHRTASISTFRHRVRVFGDSLNEPEKDLTILGWTSGDNAGALDVQIETRTSEGELILDDQIVTTVPAGTRDWERFTAHMVVPEDTLEPSNALARQRNPRALWMRLHHHPPRDGRALVAIDDLAIVTWIEDHPLDELLTLPVPHPYDFVRVRGEPGTYTLGLTFRALSWRVR